MYTFIVFVSMFVGYFSLSLSIGPVAETLYFMQLVHGFQVWGD